MKLLILSLVLFSVFSAHAETVYSYCVSSATYSPDQMQDSITISSCFKATSILNGDGANIRQSYCRGHWAHSVGLAFKIKKYPDHMFEAAESSFNQKGGSMTSMEECQTEQKKLVAMFRRNSEAETQIGDAYPVLSLFNGLVPSKVSALQFKTLRFFCKECYDK